MNRSAVNRGTVACSIVAFCALLISIGLCSTSTVSAQSGGNGSAPQEEKPRASTPDRLAPPPMSDPPTLLETGHYDYYLYCMVCHGDRGQGLTEEWRNAGDPADANCWQSRCHASNYPPGGFELPRYAPALIGEQTLARFPTIGDLYSYIQTSMPWHLPGLLEDEQYQRIALYLAAANGSTGLNETDNLADWATLETFAPTSRTVASLSASVISAPTGEDANASSASNDSSLPASLPFLAIGLGVMLAAAIVWKTRQKQSASKAAKIHGEGDAQ
ncbi:MAG: hypothetical protein KF753_23015 [Caldilineaceae bacterium]|nr:hypothetical protein [Caldilineaceae bacterium]